jgi:hypothetical protein
MSRKQYSLGKQLVLAAALALGTSGIALADDSGMNPFTGDSYAYFNGGQNFPYGKPVLDDAPSTYRPSYPQDALTYQQQHFPFLSQTSRPVATNEAALAKSPAN